jgi:hypothetical protein
MTFTKTKCGNFEITIPINITDTFVFADYAFLLERANPGHVLIKICTVVVLYCFVICVCVCVCVCVGGGL